MCYSHHSIYLREYIPKKEPERSAKTVFLSRKAAATATADVCGVVVVVLYRGVHVVAADSFHCSGSRRAGRQAGRSTQRKSNTGAEERTNANGRSNAAASAFLNRLHTELFRRLWVL